MDFEPRRVAATRAWLEQHGYRVIVAQTAPELDDVLVTSPPPVVLIEPMLPGKDGFELCRSLKRGLYGSVPRVVLASRLLRGPRYKSLAKSVGADLFLERPGQDELLIPAIQRLIEIGPEPHPLHLPTPPTRTTGAHSITGAQRTTGSQSIPTAPTITGTHRAG
ncbi:MAG: response regulator, partial [Acidobacteria bacterium]|nr:response regulator [Acidobacteriota bacterium]